MRIRFGSPLPLSWQSVVFELRHHFFGEGALHLIARSPGVRNHGRPSWSGFLRFNLISVPVKGYNATAGGGGKIGFHLLHGLPQSDQVQEGLPHPRRGGERRDRLRLRAAKDQYVTVQKEERAISRPRTTRPSRSTRSSSPRPSTPLLQRPHLLSGPRRPGGSEALRGPSRGHDERGPICGGGGGLRGAGAGLRRASGRRRCSADVLATRAR